MMVGHTSSYGLMRAEKHLSVQEKQEVQRLQALDTEVRRQEQVHAMRARPYVRSGPHYITQKGPDGQTYVVGGQINVDSSPAMTPEDQIVKARTVAAAATAPAVPSPADYAAAMRIYDNVGTARQVISSRQIKGILGQASSDPSSSSETSQVVQRSTHVSKAPLDPALLAWA